MFINSADALLIAAKPKRILQDMQKKKKSWKFQRILYS